MSSIGSGADPDTGLDERTENAILNLATDRVAREVLAALESAGIDCLLMKGPVTERWLYGGEPVRRYADIDLLTSPRGFEAAGAVLARLGFEVELDDSDTPGWIAPAHHWRRRGDDSNVDLHRYVWGAEAPPELTWEAVWDSAERMELDGLAVHVPGEPFRALHLALHALQHAPEPDSHAREALRLGLQELEPDLWAKAATLASSIEAEAALGAGLRLELAGREAADELGLPTAVSPEMARHLAGAPGGSHGLDTLLAASRRERVRHLIRKLFPTRRFMQAWSPLASRGRLGMAAAYAGLPLWVAWRALVVLRWRLARGR